jgi:hypothetical protein
MPLEFDPRTGEIIYEGKVVGHHTFDNGVSRVTLDITYECGPQDEWIVPLSYFDYGLSRLAKHKTQQKVAALTFQTSEDEIAEVFEVPVSLVEKTVKRDGYVWRFHKSDPDNWPSALHGHDYEKNLKLDAFTGDIYDVGTRNRCKKLSDKALASIQGELRASADFGPKLEEAGLH